MIYLLMITLCVLLLINFILNKKDFIAPSFIFCASFCFSSVWAVVYSKKWSLGLHINTFCVILGGVLEFIIISIIVQTLFLKSSGESAVKEKRELVKIEIENIKKIIFLIFCIFTIIFTIYSIVKVMHGSFKNIGKAISDYRTAILFQDEIIQLPKLLNYSRNIVNVAGYWFAYVVINNYLVDKKIDIFSALIVITAMISNMTTGGRGGAVNLILACIAIFVLLINKMSGFRNTIKLKVLIRFIMVGIVAIALFQATGTLLGRTATSKKSVNTREGADYLAIYCGAEIKNLDLFLQRNDFKSNKIWGSQTFIYMIRWLGPKFGLENTHYQLVLPFRYVNGFPLGNVATTFYPYIYDFGYSGVICLIGLMAFITQFVYEKCKRVKIKREPSQYILVYGFMFSSIVLSFFSNKFYEQNFNKQFLYFLIFCFIYNIIFCRIKIRKNDFKYIVKNNF